MQNSSFFDSAYSVPDLIPDLPDFAMFPMYTKKLGQSVWITTNYHGQNLPFLLWFFGGLAISLGYCAVGALIVLYVDGPEPTKSFVEAYVTSCKTVEGSCKPVIHH